MFSWDVRRPEVAPSRVSMSRSSPGQGGRILTPLSHLSHVCRFFPLVQQFSVWPTNAQWPNPWGQNHFHNNIKMCFAFFTTAMGLPLLRADGDSGTNTTRRHHALHHHTSRLEKMPHSLGNIFDEHKNDNYPWACLCVTSGRQPAGPCCPRKTHGHPRKSICLLSCQPN